MANQKKGIILKSQEHKANQIATCAGRCGWPSRDYFNFSFVSDGWESDTSFLDQ